jgi:hypothetical protein
VRPRRARTTDKGLLVLDITENVRFDPRDLELVVQTVRDDPSEPPPAVLAVLHTCEHSSAPLLTAEELWRLTQFADPSAVYDLPLTVDTVVGDERLAAHLRLWSAVREQAPRTVAALDLISRTETKLAIHAARLTGT